MDYLIQIDRIKMELFNVYLYNIRSQVTSSKLRCFIYLKIIFTLTNISYPDEMQHFAALHLGLRCLSKYSLRSQMVKHTCIAIHCNPRREGQTGYLCFARPNLGWLTRDINRRGPYSFRILPWYYVANR